MALSSRALRVGSRLWYHVIRTDGDDMTVLASSEILGRIQASPPLVAEYLDLEAQAQPNGFDLTLRGIDVLQTPGTLAVSNAERVLPVTTPLVFDGMGYIDLQPGAYHITFKDKVIGSSPIRGTSIDMRLISFISPPNNY